MLEILSIWSVKEIIIAILGGVLILLTLLYRMLIKDLFNTIDKKLFNLERRLENGLEKRLRARDEKLMEAVKDYFHDNLSGIKGILQLHMDIIQKVDKKL